MTNEITNLQEFKKEVNKKKSKLIKTVARKGIYENFGQKELRDLLDVSSKLIHYYDCPDRKEIANITDEFSAWAMTYNG